MSNIRHIFAFVIQFTKQRIKKTGWFGSALLPIVAYLVICKYRQPFSFIQQFLKEFQSMMRFRGCYRKKKIY